MVIQLIHQNRENIPTSSSNCAVIFTTPMNIILMHSHYLVSHVLNREKTGWDNDAW
jgi:hypothetical protein